MSYRIGLHDQILMTSATYTSTERDGWYGGGDRLASLEPLAASDLLAAIRSMRPMRERLIYMVRDLQDTIRSVCRDIDGHTYFLSLIDAKVLVGEECVGYPACGPQRPRGRRPLQEELWPAVRPRQRRSSVPTLAPSWIGAWDAFLSHESMDHYLVDMDQLEVWCASMAMRWEAVMEEFGT